MKKEKFITLQEASIRFKTSERNIRHWIKMKYVTGSRIGGSQFVDVNSLYEYLEIHKTLANQWDKMYRRKEEIDAIINEQKSFLYGLLHFEKNNRVLGFMVNELAKLISNPVRKEIFLDLTQGSCQVEELAQKFNLTDKEILRQYNYTCNRLFKKTSILTTYRKQLATLTLENRKQAMALRNLDVMIRDLHILLNKKPDYNNAPDEAVDNLACPIHRFGFSYIIVNALRRNNFFTLADVLSHVKKHNEDWQSLLCLRNFGLKSLNSFLSFLKEKNIIDDKGNCEYFKYLK